MRTTNDIKKGTPLVCLTAYTAPIARLADAQADIVLVGDSLGMVLYGYANTVPVTMDMMAMHGQAVTAACEQALVVVDMPFGSYQKSPQSAFENAARLLQETRCQAVKLEGGVEMAETVAFLTQRAVPVLGHVGLMPQHANARGLRKVRELDPVLADARAIEEAGAFALVLECVTPEIAEALTTALSIPVIGIGCSHPCDGRIAVSEDLLGLSDHPPTFSKPLTDLRSPAEAALQSYADTIRKDPV